MSPIKVGIVGYGFSARTFHLPFIASDPSYVIHAFLQRSDAPTVRGKPGSSCEVDYPAAKRYSNAEGFFGDKETEVVVVTTGVGTHAEMAKLALKAGMNVVVEKPFTATSKEADELLALQKQSGKILTVFQSRRYDSDFTTLEELILSGALGQVRECQMHYDWDISFGTPTKPYQPGDGLLFGLGSHTIDQALTLFGRPASVTGFYRAPQGGSTTTDVWYTVILQYSGDKADLVVTIKNMMESFMLSIDRRPNLKYFARGTEGSFLKFGVDPQEDQIGAGMAITDPSFGFEDPSDSGVLTTKTQVLPSQTENRGLWVGKVETKRGELGKYYTDLAKAIRGEMEVKVKAEQSRDCIRIIELARASADAGKTLLFE